ncbi:tyrosine--tRNA ligase 1, cytoplasmic isoform X2 [Brachypodium distachyon]|uniref:Uncharacterized protein n=1 Tax=Brachypodium distachyon TaxID=15368 RepID=A0A2K2D9J9_BRADI|nr:tyrosine--tRNA ligase 1, cytoplasmic isoform X2 [Brachypodium distachyon]PNT70956.1 hypothetical protein BRADI_2g20490v3 [Brachypodium distachyon]|eukprot:XP_014754325.1 tyrosine--tRNA ligase 1, cytoplasmic isoform X2 [Brachypodium distachyon]
MAPKLRLGLARRYASKLELNCAEEPEFAAMDSLADVVANICRESSCDERIAVLRSIGEHCVYGSELRLLLKKKEAPICYVWFEPTPWMDITQGLLKTIYVNKMVKAGYIVKILIADWFAPRNYKICNNKSKVRNIGYYNIEMWKAAGMDLDRVEIVWLSDELERHAPDYWSLALDVSRKYTMKRMASFYVDPAPFGGPQVLPAADIFYTCMQVAATLCQKLQADIWLFSMDQWDIAVLTREYCEDIKRETKPTIMLHNILPNLVDDPYLDHHYLYNMRDPKWNIFMHDKEHVSHRIRRAICPPKVAVSNPCLEYVRYVIFPWFRKFEVQKERDGSNKAFACMEELIVDYESGDLDPVDVKLALERGIYKILEHVDDYFNSKAEAQAVIMALKDQIEPTVSADQLKIYRQNEDIIHPGYTPRYHDHEV